MRISWTEMSGIRSAHGSPCDCQLCRLILDFTDTRDELERVRVNMQTVVDRLNAPDKERIFWRNMTLGKMAAQLRSGISTQGENFGAPYFDRNEAIQEARAILEEIERG